MDYIFFILFLQGIELQIASETLEKAREWLGGELVPSLGVFGGVVVPLILWIFFFAAIFILLRYSKLATDYERGVDVRHGKYRIMVQDWYEQEGMLGRIDKVYAKEIFEELKREDTLKKGVEELESLYNKGRIHLYWWHITKLQKTWQRRKFRRRTLIVSSDELPKHAWQDKLGKRSVTSVWNKEYVMNVMCAGEIFDDVKNDDGNEDTVMLLAPIPRAKHEQIRKFGYTKETGYDMSFKMDVIHLPEGRHIAQASLFMKSLAEQLGQVKNKNLELRNAYQLIEMKNKELQRLNSVNQHIRHLLTQKILIGYGRPEELAEKGFEWGWYISGILVGALSIEVWPTLDIAEGTSPYSGFVIAFFMMIIGRKVHENRMKANVPRQVKSTV